MKNILIYIVVTGLILGLGVFVLVKPQESSEGNKYDAFAQCLADKGLTMYGAYWCPHCQAQKKLFGASFAKVKYVECTTNEKLCIDKGVQGYPTWIDAQGQKHSGEQTLEDLAKIASCQLP